MGLKTCLGHYEKVRQEMLLGAQVRQESLAEKGVNLKLLDYKSVLSCLARAHPIPSLPLIASLVSAHLALKKALPIMCLSCQVKIGNKH